MTQASVNAQHCAQATCGALSVPWGERRGRGKHWTRSTGPGRAHVSRTLDTGEKVLCALQPDGDLRLNVQAADGTEQILWLGDRWLESTLDPHTVSPEAQESLKRVLEALLGLHPGAQRGLEWLGSEDLAERPHWAKRELKERGWTERSIKAHLGAADVLKPNPMFRSAAPMQLYARARVLLIEMGGEWTPHEVSQARRAAAYASAERRAAAMIAGIERRRVSVPKMPLQDLYQQACDDYNERAWDRGRDGDAHPGSDPAFVKRIAVNFLRHAATDYDWELESRRGQVGIRMGAHEAMFLRVMKAVAAAYPELRGECRRQYGHRFDDPEGLKQIGAEG